MTDKEKTYNQILKMIASGEIPKEVYNKYLSECEIGFMNYDDLKNYFDKEKSAKEMFEELDYKKMPKRFNPLRLIYSKVDNHNDNYSKYIHFHNLKSKYPEVSFISNFCSARFSLEEIIAVKRQLEELKNN